MSLNHRARVDSHADHHSATEHRATGCQRAMPGRIRDCPVNVSGHGPRVQTYVGLLTHAYPPSRLAS